MVKQEAIADQLHRFYRLMDEGCYEEAAAFFTTDGRLLYGPGTSKPGALYGSKIREAFLARRNESRPRQRHVASNLIVESHSEGVTATSVLTLYKFVQDVTPTAVIVAEVIQDWRQEEGRWKLADMRIEPLSATKQ